MAATGVGDRRYFSAPTGLPLTRAVRVVPHRDRHKPGHDGPHAAEVQEGQHPDPDRHPQTRGQGEVREAL